MKSVLLLLGAGLLIYAAFGLYLYMLQQRMIYYPVPESRAPGAGQLRLEVAPGIELKIWTLRSEAPGAVLYFGGNAEDVAGNLAAFERVFAERALYLVNYRGYGGSDGQPGEAALCGDALRIFDHLARRHPRIAVVGRSLGSGVAVHLAARRPVEKLALVTPFDSLAEVAQGHFPLFPVRWLMRERYDSAVDAPAVEAPVLVVMAELDEIIPRRRSEALVEAFARPPEVEIVPLADHNSLDAFPLYHAALQRFVAP